jgi:hypothetical protein
MFDRPEKVYFGNGDGLSGGPPQYSFCIAERGMPEC